MVMVSKMATKSSKALTPTVQVVSKPGHRYDWQAQTAIRSGSLEREFGVLLARLLTGRGVTDIAAAEKYLRPRYEHVRNYGGGKSLKDMEKALATLLPLIRQKARLVVFGDYDVDGV